VTPPAEEKSVPPEQAPIAISDGVWQSEKANCALQIPAGSDWKIQANDPMNLSLQSEAAGSLHIMCTETTTPEITSTMASSGRATSKARNQAAGNRSEVIRSEWSTFHGARAYQWVEKQWPPGKPPYFRAQLLFIRRGRNYSIQASTYSADPLKDPLIVPVLFTLRFLDER
jgi:hypothetical protein